MIEIRNKEDCCGCTSCASICPKQCILMVEDNEGFLYPYVDKSQCVDCHLCEIKCPVVEKNKTFAQINTNKEEVDKKAVDAAEYLPESYVCFLRDSETRRHSTSGGIFTAIARYALSKRGIVCGVVLDDTQKVIHTFTDKELELCDMRRSKYVQSEQSDVYGRIKNELATGRMVLYSGTPCQVAGLNAYLGKKFDNLITVDIVCHGVGSPLYWKKYLKYISAKAHSSIKEIRFREKTYGYSSATLAVYFENGKSNHKGHDDDLYWTAFSKNMIYRPSCYACAFKQINHASDFTIGDYWNTAQLPDNFKNADGCSLVLCHSKKSKLILSEVAKSIEIHPVEMFEALQINGGHQPSMLITCPSIPVNRQDWFEDMKKLEVNELVNKYLPLSIKQKIKNLSKPMLFKLGILDFIKRKK